jgi:hypothetical protein
VLALTDVVQVDGLDDYGLLIVLSGAVACFLIYLPPASNCSSEGQVITVPLDALEAIDASRVSPPTPHPSNKAYTSDVRSSLQYDQNLRAHRPERNKPTFRKLQQGANDTLGYTRNFTFQCSRARYTSCA